MTPEEEERGWEELRARWSDDEAHRAWLAGFVDLEGLARAGQRYRAHLTANAGDPVAGRWLEEVLKRATALGFASLPRTTPPPAIPRWLKGAAVATLSSLVAYALYRVVLLTTTIASGR
jgi:hypothetical protein